VHVPCKTCFSWICHTQGQLEFLSPRQSGSQIVVTKLAVTLKLLLSFTPLLLRVCVSDGAIGSREFAPVQSLRSRPDRNDRVDVCLTRIGTVRTAAAWGFQFHRTSNKQADTQYSIGKINRSSITEQTQHNDNGIFRMRCKDHLKIYEEDTST